MTVEEKALEAYPVFETTYGVDVNASFRLAFKKGYNKAVEDAIEWLQNQKEMVGVSFHDDFYERFKKELL